MRWNLLVLTSAILTAAFALTACDKKEESKVPSEQIKSIKGDPLTFVKNTQMNFNDKLPLKMFVSESAWQRHAAGFRNDSNVVDVKDVVEQQTPKEGKAHDFNDTRARLSKFDASKVGEKFSMELPSSDSSKNSILFEVISETEARATGLKSNETILAFDENLQLMHSSYTPELNQFSLLLFQVVDTQRTLVAFYFSKEVTEPKFHKTDAPYNYIWGRGEKIGWNQKKGTELLLCGKEPQVLNNLVSNSMDRWTKYLEKRLQVTVKQQDNCPPFSDVNTHTFTFVDGWVEILGEASVNAFVNALPDFSKSEIYDADGFYLISELEEILRLYNRSERFRDPSFLQSEKIQSYIGDTLTHEFGHFLGLDHQFDKNTPSMMSYEESRSITSYDVSAVRALYPEIPEEEPKATQPGKPTAKSTTISEKTVVEPAE